MHIRRLHECNLCHLFFFCYDSMSKLEPLFLDRHSSSAACILSSIHSNGIDVYALKVKSKSQFNDEYCWHDIRSWNWNNQLFRNTANSHQIQVHLGLNRFYSPVIRDCACVWVCVAHSTPDCATSGNNTFSIITVHAPNVLYQLPANDIVIAPTTSQ